jgi:alpha-beta hydrolase superfamily lysophospholipase
MMTAKWRAAANSDDCEPPILIDFQSVAPLTLTFALAKGRAEIAMGRKEVPEQAPVLILESESR